MFELYEAQNLQISQKIRIERNNKFPGFLDRNKTMKQNSKNESFEETNSQNHFLLSQIFCLLTKKLFLSEQNVTT